MDLYNKQLAEGVVADVSVAAGKVVVSLTVDAKTEADALFDSLSEKVPDYLKPLIAALKAGADAVMS